MVTVREVKERLALLFYGADPRMPYRQKVFILITGFTTLISAAGLAVNLVTGMNAVVTAITAVGTLLLGGFALSARRARLYERTVLPFFASAVAVLTATWFFNGGIESNLLSLMFAFFLGIYAVASRTQRRIVAVVFALLIPSLVLVHHRYPSLIVPYDSPEQRFTDLLLGSLLYFLFLYAVIDVIISYFDTENERIRRYNEALERSNQRLNESELKYRASIETSIDAIHIIDEVGNLFDANEAFLRHLGYTREEAAGLSIMDWEAQWGPDEAREQIGRMMRESGRFETVHRRKDGSTADVEISANRVVIGGRPLLYCAARDITEWKRKNDQMVKSERLFRQVWDQSADGMRLTDADGTIIRVNDAYCRLVGRSRTELEGRPLSVLFSGGKGDEAMRKHRENFSHHRLNAATEKKVEMWDGRSVWLMVSNSYVLAEGNRLLLLGMFRDITERKRIQDELTSYNGLLTSMLENLPFDFWARDRSGRGILQSKIGARLWGDIVHSAPGEQPAAPRTVGQWERNNARAMAGEIVRNEQEYRDEATGRTRTFYEVIAPYYAQGTVAGILGINIDVTDQKRTQAELREQKQNLETLISNLPGYVYRAVNTDGSPRILFLSSGVEGVTGYTAAELRSTVDFLTVIHPDDVQRCREVTRAAVMARDRYELEYRITSKVGEVRWMLERGRGVYDAKGRYEYTEGYVVDITGQKSAEQRLFEAFQQNDAIFTQASVGMAVTDMHGMFLRVNQPFVAMLGYSPEQLVRLSVREVTVPEDFEKELENMRTLLSGENRSFSLEKRMRKQNGGIVWVREDIVLIRDAQGSPEYFTGIIQDVTQQHHVSNAVKNLAVVSVESGGASMFDSIVLNMATALHADMAFLGLLSADGAEVDTVAVWREGGKQGDFRYRLEGTPCANALSSGSVYYPDSVAARFPDDAALKRTGMESYLGMSLTGKDGRVYGVLVALARTPMHDVPNFVEIQRLFGERAVNELERLDAESALKRSEEEHRFLVENAQDVIVQLNFRGTVTYCSPSIAALSGYAPAEVVGTSIKRYFMDPASTLDVFLRMKEAVVGGVSKAVEFRFRQRNGEAKWVEAVGRPVMLENGDVQIHGVLRDISERKKVEEALLQYKRIISATVDSISLIDDRYRYIVVNDVYMRRLGKTMDEILGRTVEELFGEELFRRVMKDHFDRSLAGVEVHYQAWFDFAVEGRRYMDVQYMPYRTDGFTGVLVSSRDITDIVKAEEAVTSSEERFRIVWESSSEAMRLTNADGTMVLVNEAFGRLVGLPAAGLSGRPMSSVYPEQDREDALRRFRANFEARSITPFVEAPIGLWNGVTVHVQAANTFLTMPAGDTLLLTVFRDITARVEAERHRKRAEERYRGIVNSALDGFISVDLEGRFLEVNDVYCRMVGYTREELLTMRVSDVELVEDAERTRSHIDMMMRTGGDRFETKHRTRNDGTVFVEVSAIYLAEQRLIIAFIANISQRKENEASLQESERRFRSILENVSLAGVMLDIDGRIRVVNDYLVTVSGWTRKELLGRSWFDMLIAEEDRTDLRRIFTNAIDEGRIPVHHENDIVTKSGERRWIRWNNIYLYDRSGNVIGITSLGEDATEVRRAQEELRASKEQYQLLADNSLDIIALHDFDGRFLYVSPSLRQVLGYEEEELIGRGPLEYVHPDDAAAFRDAAQAGARSGDQRYGSELRFRHRDGSFVWVDMRTNPIVDPASGRVVRLQTITRDISVRKRTEAALREREEQYRTLITTMQQGLALHEVIVNDEGTVTDYRFLDMNPSYERMTGLTRERTIGRTVRGVLPGIEEYWIEKFGRVAQTGQPLTYENYDASMDKYFEVIAYRPRHQQFAVIVTDITQRRRAEVSVKESEQKYRLLAENSTDVIWTTDMSGSFTYISPSVRQLRGYAPEEVLRQDLEEMVCPGSLPVMSDVMSKLLRQARESGRVVSEYVEVEQPTKDGATVWTEVVTHLMVGTDREPIGILGVSRDITERKRREALLTTRLRLSEFANSHTVPELLRMVLDEAEKITDSTAGFFRFAEEGPHAGASPAWSDNARRRMRRSPEDAPVHPGLGGKAWTEEIAGTAPAVMNDGAARSRRWEMPEGCVPIDRELLVPILRNDRAVAVLGLANKQNPYDHRDTEIASQLATMAWDILERRRAELAVIQQEKALAGLSRAAVSLLNMTESNFAETIRAALNHIGNGLGGDRVYIFRNDDTAPVGTVRTTMEHEWTADGITPEIDNESMKGLELSILFPERCRVLMRGDAYRRAVRETVGEERRILEAQSIQTIILVPIHLHGRFWGFLGVDSVREMRRWSDDDISVLRVASESFGIALERRAAVAMLHENEQILKLALEASGDGIWIYSVPTRDMFFSDETLRLIGHSAQSAPTSFDEWLALVHPDDREGAVGAMERHLRGNEPVFVNEHRFLVADGTYRWMLHRGKVLRWDDDGRPYQIYGTYSDIHHRKESERKIVDLNERLEQKVEERTSQLRESIQEMESFSYSISHDLRAPVRAIDSFAKILNDEEAPRLSDEGKRLLMTVRTNTARMGRMIDDLLQFSRASRAEIQKTRFDMTRIVTKLLDEAVAAERGRRIVTTVRPMPEAYGDASLLRQALVNLISNAVKFTRKRDRAVIEIGGTVRDGMTVFTVTDNGTGFDMRYKDKLFGVFQRLHSQQEFEGTGVGLAIVHRIVQKHGGTVDVTSAVDDGTTFTIAIPADGMPDDITTYEQRDA